MGVGRDTLASGKNSARVTALRVPFLPAAPWPAASSGLDQEHADPTADSVGYIQVPLWLSQDELAELIDEVRSALLARRDNEPTPGRSPYLVSPILFPLGEQDRRASRTARAEPSS